jgi:hypothetical protein
MSLKFILPGTVTDASLPIDYLDPVIAEGTLFVGDGRDSFSWPSQAAPANGDLLKNIDDINNDGNDATWMEQSGSAIGFADGVFDFTGLTTNKNSLLLPASIADALWGGDQYFALCMYLKLPAQADWWTATSDRPFITWAGSDGTAAGNWTNEADLLMIGQQFNSGTTERMWFRRQTAINAVTDLSLVPDASHFDNLVQVLYYRNSSGAGARIKGAAATVSTTGATGAANAADFSGKRAQLGIGSSFWPSSSMPSAINWGVKRVWMEDLSVSGRDPLTVADADFDFGVAA